MTNYYTADWHLSEFNEDNHNEKILQGINSKVKATDNLFVLGDLSMYDKENEIKQVTAFIDQIECNNIYICEGNHDSTKLCEALLHHSKVRYVGPAMVPKDVAFTCKFTVALSHYPVIDYHLKGGPTMMLHGHSHGILGYKLPDLFDVGVDSHNFVPVSVEELLSKYYGDHANPYMGYIEHLRQFRQEFLEFMKKHNR